MQRSEVGVRGQPKLRNFMVTGGLTYFFFGAKARYIPQRTIFIRNSSNSFSIPSFCVHSQCLGLLIPINDITDLCEGQIFKQKSYKRSDFSKAFDMMEHFIRYSVSRQIEEARRIEANDRLYRPIHRRSPQRNPHTSIEAVSDPIKIPNGRRSPPSNQQTKINGLCGLRRSARLENKFKK